MNRSFIVPVCCLCLTVSLFYTCGPSSDQAPPQPDPAPAEQPVPVPHRETAPIDTVAFLKKLEADMVPVPGGSFKMGSDSLQPGNRPVHEVTVSDFYMQKYPVTVEQFRTFVTATGYITSGEQSGGGFVLDHADEFVYQKGVTWEDDETGKKRPHEQTGYPVLYVSWNDADSFCLWLSAISGQTYRLPTEAEWEFANSGGTKSKQYRYSGGNRLDEVAWYGLNSDLKVQPVGKKRPNELGIYDLTGLVWQWCNDWYAQDYYTGSPAKDPMGPDRGDEKVCRGGCYLSGLYPETLPHCERAFRGKEVVDVSANDATFRVVRVK